MTELIHLIEHLLYQVSNALYLPVIAGCALLVAYVPVQLGMTLFDGWQRRRGRQDEVSTFRQQLISLQRRYRNRPRQLAIEVERELQVMELELVRRLDRIRFVIKLGPALGLMGTLIPMGISLAALAEGNIPKMAGSMVTAFTATVAGLGAGALAYMIAMPRERWLRADVRDMAHAAELLLAETDGEHVPHLLEEAEDAIARAA